MDNSVACPHCGSEKIRKTGISMNVSGPKQRYHCRNCGHTFYSSSEQIKN